MSLNESKAEKILGVFFVIFGAVLLLAIIPSQIKYVEGAFPQPRFFPQIIAGLMVVLGVALFASGRKKTNAEEQDTYSLTWQEGRLVLVTLALIALYVGSLYFVPYLPATMIALAVLITVYGQRNIIKIVGVSAVVPIIVYVGLTYGLKLRLP